MSTNIYEILRREVVSCVFVVLRVEPFEERVVQSEPQVSFVPDCSGQVT